jgi:hypothetical protein
MKCKQCGEQIEKQSQYCPSCGAKQENDEYTAPRPFETNSIDETNNPQYQKSTFKGKQTTVGTSGKIEFKKGGFFRKVINLGVIVIVIIIALVIIFGSGPSISNIESASEIDFETFEPVLKTSTFSPSTPEIFVTFDIDGYDIGTFVVGEWYYVTDNTLIDEVTLTTQYESQYAYFSLTRPFAGWPVGDYKLDILISDEVVETVEFNVE